MNTELLGVIATFLLTLLIAIPFGKYVARSFSGERSWALERWIYKLSGINAKEEMHWRQLLKCMIAINMLWFVYAFFMLMYQDRLPLNPDGNPAQTPDLAFNTAISFLVNCDLQHYSGESGLTYFTQLFVITFLQFVSAATGIAAMVAVMKAFRDRTVSKLGNFWVYLTRATTRILLPISIVVALILAFSGTPASYAGKDTVITMQGDTVGVSRGPAAGMIAIKHVGTNGGGWFGANSIHPFENPSYLTNITEAIAQMIIPIAMIFAFGFFINRKRVSKVIFGVMTIGFLALLIPTMLAEINGNPAIAQMGISQATGAMEGKEMRFGPAATGYWSIITTVVSTGSVNGFHDSMMPVSGLSQLLAMMINCFYGGCGVGLLNYFIFIIIAVFISGLMVGRTPELFGHKVEAREVKIAAIVALLHPLLILAGTALSSYFLAHGAPMSANWLNNPTYHGFSETLYEYTSAAANNGSGYEGLGDNNLFWNISTGFVLIISRFLPIIGPVAIAGILAQKKYIPESAGTLKTDTATFGLMTFAVIVILAALSFFPSLALGPVAEYFYLYK